MKYILCGLVAMVLSGASHAAAVTAYCDKGIMADGHRVHVGACAGPRWIPLGTRVVIGGEVYTVEDRTNRRLDGRYDIWRPWSRARCPKFGKRNMVVKVLG